VAVYSVDENLTPVLLPVMHACFMSYLLVLALVLKELVLVLVLVLLQLQHWYHEKATVRKYKIL